MNKIKIYINDNYINLLKNNKVYHLILRSINSSNITNSSLFIKEIKKYNILPKLLTYSLELLLNKVIEEKDIIYYKAIFDELNCNKLNIYSTSKYLDNNTLIVNSDNYILYTNNKYNYIEKDLLTSYINYYDISKLKVISYNKIKPINKVKIYYYNDIDTYFFK